jgi:hypothetical protein
MKTLKRGIEGLDPAIHGALREALRVKYRHLSHQHEASNRPDQCIRRLFEEMFKKAANDLGERYLRGTTEYIQQHHPELHREIETADIRMNEVWSAGLVGKASPPDFRSALGCWYKLYLKAIQIYAREKGDPGRDDGQGEHENNA